MDLEVRYHDIEPREIVAYLLRETEQLTHDSLKTDDLLDYLGLSLMQFDFTEELPKGLKKLPRALLSFPYRMIATHNGLPHARRRFSVLHEIGHYVLPSHQRTLYLCDEKALSSGSRIVFECEANVLAADLMFMADKFTLEANSCPVKAQTIKLLAEKYDASFEATARRLVEKSFQPCMLLVFKEEDGITAVDTVEMNRWEVRYCVASSAFSSRHGFSRLDGSPPESVVEKLRLFGDISDSIVTETTIGSADKTSFNFYTEYFTNTYNIFALLTPRE